MKILHTVEFYSPSVGGAQEVVKQLSEHLVMLGHDVTVATTKLPNRKKTIINGVKIREFDISGNDFRGYKGIDQKKYQKFLINGHFDVIMNYAAQEWTADLVFPILSKIKAKKIFVPCGYSGLYDPSYHDYFAKLPAILRQYDRCVYLSEDYRDINFAKELKLKNSVIIPNGADEREFAQLNPRGAAAFRARWGIKPDEKLFLTVSTHTGFKGHSETIEAFQRANVSNAVLMIVGDTNKKSSCYGECVRKSWINNHLTPSSLARHKRIMIVNLSRHETILAFQAADLFVFLSNIECSPLVLFESAASGTPFIASSAGNASEIADWTGAGMITTSRQLQNGFTEININDTTRLIEKLASDQGLCDRLGDSGRRAWESHYTWDKLTRQYLTIYKGHK